MNCFTLRNHKSDLSGRDWRQLIGLISCKCNIKLAFIQAHVEGIMLWAQKREQSSATWNVLVSASCQ